MTHPLFTSRTEEWTSPPHIVKIAEQVLGHIDLDPCAETERAVPASTHYTAAEDGLAQPWRGRVYMNPPYGRKIRVWIDRVVSAYETGEIEAAVLLIHARTDTRWARQLRCYPRCYIYGRLRFGGSANAAPFPSMLVYLGPDVERFARVTSALGDTYCLFTAPVGGS